MKRLIFLVALAALGCSNEKLAGETDMTGQFVFGVSYGFCAGDCAHFYRLKDGELFADNMDRFTGDNYVFNSTTLTNEKYQKAKELFDSFPQYLMEHPNETIGCPDCADQGGFHLLRIIQGDTIHWHIDTNSGSQPAEIREYMERVRTTLDELAN